MRFTIEDMSERDVLNEMKVVVRSKAEHAIMCAKIPDAPKKVRVEAAVWRFASYIINGVVRIATEDQEFFLKGIPDCTVSSEVCGKLGINREALDHKPFEFIDSDDEPMDDAEFEKWFHMLWDAVWSDKDSRFNGKTIGETWVILEREENFPKERFRKELERRGYLHMAPEEEQHPPIQLNYHPDRMKECEELLKKIGWELFDVEPSGNHAKIKHCSLIVDIRINDCIDFVWDEGSKSYAIKRHDACSAA